MKENIRFARECGADFFIGGGESAVKRGGLGAGADCHGRGGHRQ